MSIGLPTMTPHLAVDLQYYPTHQALLAEGEYLRLGTPSAVQAFRADPQIPLQDFLNYFLIQRAQGPEYATYGARLEQIDQSIIWMRNAISTAGTVNTLASGDRMQEAVGEAISLSVANRLFGLTQADWRTIPIQRGRAAHKTFDFEMTWDGVCAAGDIIQIEAKGSFVKDNTIDQAAVNAQAGKIVKKKKSIQTSSGYRHPAAARYGMIASIDPMNKARCWLLDPPGDQYAGDPLNLKVANRLEFVAFVLSMIAPKAKFPSALKLRAGQWRDGAVAENAGALVSRRRHSFAAGYYVEDFLSKGKVLRNSGDVLGQFFVGKLGKPFFIGIRTDLVRTAINQNRTEIVKSLYTPTTERETLRVNAVRWGLARREDRGRMSFDFHTSSSGVILGLPAL